MKKQVVIGLLGTQLDGGRLKEKWEKWRPSVSICQQEDFVIDRFEMLYESNFEKLANTIREDMLAVSPETEVVLRCIEFGDPWDFEAVYGALHDFARSYLFNQDEEDYLIHITTGTHVCQICLFLLTESRHLPARLLQSSPPKRKTHGVIGGYSVIDLDLSRYDPIAARFEEEQQESLAFLKSGIETRNATFNKLIEEIESVAIHSKSPILLMGPTGAGKSQLAKRVYELKKAKSQVSGRFVEINCGTLRGDAAMSTLFGHVKGSFTGALSDRPGLLRSANKGIVFLDEIGELGLDEQGMLLRALEEKRFFPLGSDVESESDFQLISGTNRDLLKAVKSGKFRSDLLARINLWTFELPGLKDRREDIEPNLEYELDSFTRDHGRRVRFNKEALIRYCQFAQEHSSVWSGNFRDLNASVVRMATLAGGRRINIDVVEAEIGKLKVLWREERSRDLPGQSILESVFDSAAIMEIDRFDKAQLSDVIHVCRQSKTLSDAGRALYDVSRTKRKSSNDADRLRKYLARFGLDWDTVSSRNDVLEK